MSADKEEILDSPLSSGRSMKAVEDKAKEILPNIHISLDKQKSKKRKPSKKMVIIKKDKKEGEGDGDGEDDDESKGDEGPSSARAPAAEEGGPASPPRLYQPSGAVGPAFPPDAGAKDSARHVPEAADIAAAAEKMASARGKGPPKGDGADEPKGSARGMPVAPAEAAKEAEAPAEDKEKKPKKKKSRKGKKGEPEGAPEGAPSAPAAAADKGPQDPAAGGTPATPKSPKSPRSARGRGLGRLFGDKKPTDEEGPSPKDVVDAAKEKAAPVAAVAAAALEPDKATEPAKSPKGKGKSPRVPGAGEPSGKGPDDDAEKKRGFGKKLSSLKGFFVPEDKDKGKKEPAPEDAAKAPPKDKDPGAAVAAGKPPQDVVGSHPIDLGAGGSKAPPDKGPEGLADKARDAAKDLSGKAKDAAKDEVAKAAPAVGDGAGKSPKDDLAKRTRELVMPVGPAGSPAAQPAGEQPSTDKEAPVQPKKSARGLGKKLSNLGGRFFGGGDDKGKKGESPEDAPKPTASDASTKGPVTPAPTAASGADKGKKESSAAAAAPAAKDGKPGGSGASSSDADKGKAPGEKTRELQLRPQPRAPEVDPAEESSGGKPKKPGVVRKALSDLGLFKGGKGQAAPEPLTLTDRAYPSTGKTEPSSKGKGVVAGVPVSAALKAPPPAAVSGSEPGAAYATANKGGIPNAVQNVGVGAAFGALGLAFFLFGKRDDVGGDVMARGDPYICDSPWPIPHEEQWMQNWLWHAE